MISSHIGNYFIFFIVFLSRDGTNAFWTGFFTSRVVLKGEIRENSRFLETMKNYLIMQILNPNSEYKITEYRDAILSSIEKMEKS